jgi:excinuclease ABC subunit C
MKLQCSLPLTDAPDAQFNLESCPPKPAVFALYLDDVSGQSVPPYLGRTGNLHRRLARLIGKPRPGSRLLNLHEQARRVEFTCTGSSLESLWLLYLLNKTYYPESYRQRLRLKPPAMLKLNIGNRFPRLYPTRRMSRDRAEYYGPFPSRVAAERFASEFLDFFKIRRCVEDLNPDPAHPGCIYSQMKMCLAPCFQGCTDDEYQNEVRRVVGFLDDAGRPLVRELEAERTRASDSLDFESAAKIHSKIEKVGEVMRARDALARNVRDLDAVLVVPGAELKSVTFFRVVAGELHGPANLSLDENVSAPISLDEQIRGLLEPLGQLAQHGKPAESRSKLPLWEHLSLLARWYYSSFRTGEILMLDPARVGSQTRGLPTRALIRACRKVLAVANPRRLPPSMWV